MIKQVIIEIDDEENSIEDGIRETLHLIEEGYTNGYLGCSNDRFEVNDVEDYTIL